MMFDNNLNVTASGAKERFVGGAPSRLLVLRLDEDSMVAYVEWELELAEHSCVYGDNDRLPSGNLLGSFWVTDFDVAEWNDHEYGDEQFDARVVEVVRDTQLPAWRASVQGERCHKGTCDNLESGGGVWYIYSVERFYPTPLVHSLSCASGELGFASHNVFKQQNADVGYYVVKDTAGATLADGEFGFKAHWTPANVTVAVPSSTEGTVTLEVTNAWNQSTTVDLTCTGASDRPGELV